MGQSQFWSTISELVQYTPNTQITQHNHSIPHIIITTLQKKMKEHTQQTLIISIGLSLIFSLSILGIFLQYVIHPHARLYRNTLPWIIHTDVSVNHMLALDLIIRNSENGTILAVSTMYSDLFEKQGQDRLVLNLNSTPVELSVRELWQRFFDKRRSRLIFNSQYHFLNYSHVMDGMMEPLSPSTRYPFRSEQTNQIRRNYLSNFVDQVLDRGSKHVQQIGKENLTMVEQSIKSISESKEKVSILVLGPLTNLAVTLVEMKKTPKVFDNIKKIYIYGGHENVTSGPEYNLGVDPDARDIVFGFTKTYLKNKVYLIPVDYVDRTPLINERTDKFQSLFNTGCKSVVEKKSTKTRPLLFTILTWWNNYSSSGVPFLPEELILNNEVAAASVIWNQNENTRFDEKTIYFDGTIPGIFATGTPPNKEAQYTVSVLKNLDWYKYYGVLLHKCAYNESPD